jgi:solute carrier family 25 S-adenosylmethionine transporter 26
MRATGTITATVLSTTSRFLFFALLLISCSQCCYGLLNSRPKVIGTRCPSMISLHAIPGAKSYVEDIGGPERILSENLGPSASKSSWRAIEATTHTPPVTQIALSTVFALLVLCSAPLPSNAGFGSGGAAVQSFPEVKALSTEDFLKLSPSKQRQREFSVSCLAKGSCETGANRLYEEVKQFNADAREEEKLQNQLAEMEKRVLTVGRSSTTGFQDSIESRLQLEESLKFQTELLEKLGKQPPWVSYMAAAVGSIVSTLIMHPVDTIKVQMMNSKKERSSGGDDEEPGTADDEDDAPLDLANAYKGIFANIVKEAPSSALYLGIYEFARTYLTSTPLGDQPLVIYLLAGAMGELFGSLLRAPAEAVKTRLQVGISDEDGVEITALTAAKQVIFTQSGRENLFNSWSTSLLRDIPMGAVQLAVFESAKTYVISSPTINLDVSTLSSEALFGCIGGSIGAFITTPADVITTISINSLSDVNLAQYREKSPMEVLQMLNAEGGMAALFTGWRERTLYWTPAIGIFLSIYCGSRQFALSVL